MKKKAKKARQWKLKGWVGVPTGELAHLKVCELGYACRRFDCGFTKEDLVAALKELCQTDTHTILRLDIIATEQ